MKWRDAIFIDKKDGVPCVKCKDPTMGQYINMMLLEIARTYVVHVCYMRDIPEDNMKIAAFWFLVTEDDGKRRDLDEDIPATVIASLGIKTNYSPPRNQ